MDVKDKNKLLQIRKLLKEAYDHYFKYSDGHCKSAEASISIEFGNYWTDEKCELPITGVSIYSYVLGPSRDHYFSTIDKALQTVIQWHKEEMSHDYEKDRLEEEAYWNSYHKQNPEKKTQFINPNHTALENNNERSRPS